MNMEDETTEQLRQRFPELDEAARERAFGEVARGIELQAAFAQESVMLQMVRAYNR